jgi:site-specific recombinase XerD
VRSFYRYCEDEDIVAKSPANRVRLPKVSADSTTHGMTRQECILFMAAAERRPVQHALCCLLFLSGLRVSEACGANIEDLGFEGGHRTLTVTRKGNKRQTIPLPPKVVRVIEQAVGTRTAGPILLTAAGTRMTRRNAARTVDVIARRAKLPYHVHPHMGRHSFVTTALDAGAALNDVQDSAGHADPRTTMRYNRRRGQLDRNSSYLVTAFLATS